MYPAMPVPAGSIVVDRRANQSRVIRLHRQNPRRRLQIRRRHQQRSRSVIRRHTHVFEHIRAHQKAGIVVAYGLNAAPFGICAAVASVWKEVPRLIAGCATAEEPSAPISSRTCLPSSTATSVAYEAHLDGAEWHCAATAHRACRANRRRQRDYRCTGRRRGRIGHVDRRPESRQVIKVGFQILQVQREVQNISVGERGRSCGRAR